LNNTTKDIVKMNLRGLQGENEDEPAEQMIQLLRVELEIS
jgi:hypothetical protein